MSAAIDHAADLRIEARAVWRTIEAETTRHNAIFARIRSIEQEVSDIAETVGDIRRGR